MKRFLLFSGLDYYPSGGWADFLAGFDTLEEAITGAANISGNDWWHIVDLEIKKVVEWKKPDTHGFWWDKQV